jgi:hypothetical protein
MTADTVEYPFKIEGLRRETLPMARLAVYVADLAKLLGSVDQVHFDRLEEGSVVIVSKVEQEAKPVVSPRVRSIHRGEGPADAMAAWKKLNEHLTEDAATAELTLPGGEIIPFPGKPRTAWAVGPVRQTTSIQGRLVRLEGAGERVWVGIDDDAGLAGRISVTAERAKELGAHFHRFVRISGVGRWRREEEGRWVLEHLDADTFEVLDDAPITDVLRRVREKIPPGAAASALERIRDLRDA